MTRVTAILGSILFFAIAPVTVAGIVPWWISRWQVDAAFFGIGPLRILGGVLIAAGLPVLVESFARFALEGLGTPAPIAPPRHLVVRGVYRHVRNPIYLALLAIVFGQAILLGSVNLLTYGAAIWLAFHLFVVVYEEPDLRRRFGDDYKEYRAGVPRWLPRIGPWSPTGIS
jgi:protein-S-isoprenylcysteine O-methyltransferase Ste14